VCVKQFLKQSKEQPEISLAGAHGATHCSAHGWLHFSKHEFLSARALLWSLGHESVKFPLMSMVISKFGVHVAATASGEKQDAVLGSFLKIGDRAKEGASVLLHICLSQYFFSCRRN